MVDPREPGARAMALRFRRSRHRPVAELPRWLVITVLILISPVLLIALLSVVLPAVGFMAMGVTLLVLSIVALLVVSASVILTVGLLGVIAKLWHRITGRYPEWYKTNFYAEMHCEPDPQPTERSPDTPV